MTALVLSSLRSRARSLVALCAGSFLVLVVLAGTYSAYGGAAAFAKSFGGGKTPRLLSAFSGSASGDLFEPQHYLAFGFGHPLFLVLALSVAITTGVGAIAGDVETGRAELLFTAPVSRAAMLSARVVEWGAAQLALVAAAVGGALLGTRFSADLSHVSPAVPIRVAVQFAGLVFFVAAVAFLASAVANSRGAAFAAAVGVTAGSYVVNLIALLWGPLEFARRLNPFGYYSPTTAAAHVQWGDLGVLVAAGCVLLALAFRRMSGRDLA
jgi:ABC-type transport system involved in multi-copper enzyme maturation permease subunit